MRYEDRLHRVMTYVFENPDGDLSLDNLADVAAMSRFHWHRVFHAMTGETCAQMVRRVRLHAAAGRLVREDTAVGKIARECGYPNPRSFAQAFRQSYGVTPATFRKNGKFAAPVLQKMQGKRDMFPIEIKELPARKIIGLAHEGSYMKIGEKFEKMWVMVGQRGLFSSLGVPLGVYYDDPNAVAEGDLRSFAGAEWTGGEIPEGFDSLDIPAGRAAVLTFKGPYAKLATGYDHMFGEWLPKSGEFPAEQPSYELYLNDPRKESPEDLLTEICVPLK